MSNLTRAGGAMASTCGMEVWTCSGVGCTAFPKHSHRTWWPHTNIKMLAHSSGNPCSCMFSMGKPGWTKSKHLEKSKEARTFWFSSASLSSLHAQTPGISSLYGTARRPETQSIPEPCGVQDEETNRRKMLATAIGRKDPTVPPSSFLKWTWRICSHACGIVITETNKNQITVVIPSNKREMANFATGPTVTSGQSGLMDEAISLGSIQPRLPLS